MMYTISINSYKRIPNVPRQYWTETCFTLSNGIKCNWDFFDMLHRCGFIGR